MKKIILLISLFLFFFVTPLFSIAFAYPYCDQQIITTFQDALNGIKINLSGGFQVTENTEEINIEINDTRLLDDINRMNGIFFLEAQVDSFGDLTGGGCPNPDIQLIYDQNTHIYYVTVNKVDNPRFFSASIFCSHNYELLLRRPSNTDTRDNFPCKLGDYTAYKGEQPEPLPTSLNACTARIEPAYPDVTTKFDVIISDFNPNNILPKAIVPNTPVQINCGSGRIIGAVNSSDFKYEPRNRTEPYLPVIKKLDLPLDSGQYNCTIQAWSTIGPINPDLNLCSFSFEVVQNNPNPNQPPPGATSEPGIIFEPTKCGGSSVDCTGLTREECQDLKDRSPEGIETALGCFPTDPAEIVQWILKYSIMMAGGIGFMLMLFASFKIMTSSGDPEKLKDGQKMLGSVIMGLIIIVFAVFILRFIGVTVLKIPGWS